MKKENWKIAFFSQKVENDTLSLPKSIIADLAKRRKKELENEK